tara:strand:- start:737 stop:2050 length:1314 start_codon:yes stop_codon:yes gene_type:complete
MTKPWFSGYNNLDNIISEIKTPQEKTAFGKHITSTLEQQGLLASQAQPYIDVYEQAAAATSVGGALTHKAQNAPSAVDRGDIWGSSGDDRGKSFLQQVAEGKTTATVEELYSKGFGREADADGLKHWKKTVAADKAQGGMDIKQIAEFFGKSQEAKVRDVYHEEYGRDADDRGLQHWLTESKREGGLGATGVEAIKEGMKTSIETDIRNEAATVLGQHSRKADRGEIFTDAQGGGYDDLDWTDFKWDADKTGGDVVEKAGVKTGVAKYVAEGGGSYKEDFAARAAAMDAAAKAQTIEGPKYMPTIADIQNNTKPPGDNWQLLTAESREKKREEEKKKKPPGYGDEYKGTEPPYTEPADFDPSATDHSKYQDEKTNLESKIKDPTTETVSKMFNTGYTRAGGSAKGVRLKRSKKFTSGDAALGTKQLSRQLQIRNLNI